MTFGIKYLIYSWLLVGRFLFEGRTPNLPLDVLYVIVCVAMFKWEGSILLYLTTLISISVLYNDLILSNNLHVHNNIFSALGALITFYIAFNPKTLWKQL